MTDQDKPNNIVNLEDVRDRRAAEAAIDSVIDENGNRAEMIFDPCSTIGSFTKRFEKQMDMLAISKVIGVFCDTDQQLIELLKERQTVVFYKAGEKWVEFDHVVGRELDRTESIARTLAVLGSYTHFDFPVRYINYQRFAEQEKEKRRKQATGVIDRIDNPRPKSSCLFVGDFSGPPSRMIITDTHIGGRNFNGKAGLMLGLLAKAFTLPQNKAWLNVPFANINRKQERDKVTKAKIAEGYVVKATAGPKKHGDRNATQFVKDVKPHPLLKGLVKKMEN
jgi:hypothetical protein